MPYIHLLQANTNYRMGFEKTSGIKSGSAVKKFTPHHPTHTF